MKPEEFSERLQAALPQGLRSVVLYGSAAAGDHVAGRSDYNVLVVTDRIGMEELRALSGVSRTWVRAGNPAPLLFTAERLRKSADVFPIELLDIRQSHRVLFGEDLVAGLDVSKSLLRLELEHELKGKLIQLCEAYLACGGKPKAVMEVMVRSFSTFGVLLRAALRLFRNEIPVRKLDVIHALAEHVEFDREAFLEVHAARLSRRGRTRDVDDLFGRYVAAVEQIVDRVDDFIHEGRPSKEGSNE